MQQHEFNDELVNAIARQNARITRGYNLTTFAIVISAINTLAIAAAIMIGINR